MTAWRHSRFRAGDRALPLDEAARRFGSLLDDVARRAARRLPLRFPAGYAALADPSDPADPIRRIAWPDPAELAPDPGALPDPVGEVGLRGSGPVIRKYPDRVLLLVTSRCHFYCRFCFRAGHGEDPSPAELEAAIDALAGERGIREVILSGGDPLTLPDEDLARILRRLARLPDLAAVRIHTRAPVHDPQRVTAQLIQALLDAAPCAVWCAVHVTHPRELTPACEAALWLFQRAGIPLLSQTVLLRGVNDDPGTLAELFTALYARRVKPYYLHHPDRVEGAARFRLTLDEGLGLFRALRARLPGPAVPAYVLDLPDGAGKVPVESLERLDARRWRAHLPDGRVSDYTDIDAP